MGLSVPPRSNVFRDLVAEEGEGGKKASEPSITTTIQVNRKTERCEAAGRMVVDDVLICQVKATMWN